MHDKILLEKRPDGLYDATGVFVSNGMYTGFDLPKENNTSIQDLIKLKEAGFTSDEITDMRAKGVI